MRYVFAALVVAAALVLWVGRSTGGADVVCDYGCADGAHLAEARRAVDEGEPE